MSFYLASTSNAADGHSAEEDTSQQPIHPVSTWMSQHSGGPSSHTGADHEIHAVEKPKTSLEIILSPEIVCLKGTGPDVEPALLSGHVVLYLTESTSIKEITLSFRGKARLPVPPHEHLSLNSSVLSYSICSHEWSFLEGEKKHSHTLKAGRHLFPFQLQIGGSLPSSIFTNIFGGASILYKLRAVCIPSGFLAHNLQAIAPVTIMRSFTSEALEYQQTLEIENTWPEKIMYLVMMPHKAWAIGDKLTALAKFSPLSKGVKVLSVTTTIHETTKLYARYGCLEHCRVVTTSRHEIIGHQAVPVEEQHHPIRTSLLHSTQPRTNSMPSTPGIAASHRSSSSNSTNGYFAAAGSSSNEHTSPSVTPEGADFPLPIPESNFDPTLPEDHQLNTDDVVTHLSITIPRTTTPSHGLEPIAVSHRIRWSMLITNPDGHTSELRCSLPIHLLDDRLLQESQMHTAVTRQLLLGGPEVSTETRDELELPSYKSHIHDRVANMFLPDGATIRVANPWVRQSSNPVVIQNTFRAAASGTSTPFEVHPVASQLPHAPGSGSNTPLEWVNSELLLSLSQNEPPQPRSRESPPLSGGPSRPQSNHASRGPSRAPSPDQHLRGHRTPHSPPSPAETFVHGGSASRNVQGVFQASMKPLSSLSSSSWLPSRSHSHSNLVHAPPPRESDHQYRSSSGHGTPLHMSSLDPQLGPALLHRAFTEVPDYGIASRGFIGGVPPLSSSRDLPSYDETERSYSDSNLAAQFARAHLDSEVVPRSSSSHPNTTGA